MERVLVKIKDKADEGKNQVKAKVINYMRKHSLLVILIVLAFIPVIIGLLMNTSCFDDISGSNDGWLGFWGGYLGSIAAILGVYWQVHVEIQNNKENQYKEARPIFILNIMDGSMRYQKEEPTEYNIKPVELPAYISKECCKKCNYRFAWCQDSSIDLPYVQLRNISEKPMLAIKVKLIWANNLNESFNISRLNPNSSFSLIHSFAYRYYCNFYIMNIAQHKISLDELSYVELHYLTAQNEKIFMKFKIKEMYKSPDLVERRLEGKGDFFSVDEYQIDNFVESVRIDNNK